MTIDNTVVVALISLASAVLVAVINNKYNQKNITASQDKHFEEITAQNQQTVALIEYKIEELRKNVEKHNNVIERTYALEKDMTLVKEKISVANNRIADLEEVNKK